MDSTNDRHATGSSPCVGSSMISNSGSGASVRPRLRPARSPRDRSFTRLVRLEVEMPDDAAEDLFIPAGIKSRLKIAALLDTHPAVELMFLGQIADARPRFRWQVADVMAENVAPAPRRLRQSQQHAYGCGFPGTVASQKRKNTSARHIQVQAFDGRLAAKVSGQTPGANNGLFIHCLACLPSPVSTGRVSSRMPPSVPDA